MLTNRKWGILLIFFWCVSCYAMEPALPLHEAVRAGNIESVTEMLARGIAIDVQDERGNTALHLAALQGNSQLLHILLDAGMLLKDVKNHAGFTLAHCAACSENGIFCLQLLLERGVDIEARNISGLTPLACAAFRGRIDAVRYLLSKKADITAQAVDRAFRRENFEIFALLLNDLVARHQKSGLNVLSFSVQQGLYLEAEFLLQLHFKLMSGQQINESEEICSGIKIDVDSQDSLGRAPIHYAVIVGRPEFIKLLAENRAKLDIEDESGQQVVHYVIKSGSLAMMKELFKYINPLEWTDRAGRTVIHVAIDANQPAILRYLAYQFHDLLNRHDKEGRYPLHAAVQRGLVQVIQDFLDNGAQTNLQDGLGKTSLHYAADGRDPVLTKQIIDRLIANGASVLVPDLSGNLPHAYVQHEDIRLYLDKLVDAELTKKTTPEYPMQINQADEPLAAAAAAAPARMIADDSVPSISRKLERMQIDPKVVDEMGRTILQKLVIKGQVTLKNLIEKFVIAGGDINARDNQGKTALHYAVELRSQGTYIANLLENGADPSIKDNDGKTPQDYVRHAAQRAHFVHYLASRRIVPGPAIEPANIPIRPALRGAVPQIVVAAPVVAMPRAQVIVAPGYHIRTEYSQRDLQYPQEQQQRAEKRSAEQAMLSAPEAPRVIQKREAPAAGPELVAVLPLQALDTREDQEFQMGDVFRLPKAPLAPMRTHSEERPYKYTYEGCSYAAAQAENLTSQIIRWHSEEPMTQAGISSACELFPIADEQAPQATAVVPAVPVIPHSFCETTNPIQDASIQGSHAQYPESSYQCDECGQAIEGYENYWEHRFIYH